MNSSALKSEYLSKLHGFAFENSKAFATYSPPNSLELISMLQCETAPVVINSISDLKNRSGFVLAPFDLSSKHPIRLIEPDYIFSSDKELKYFFESKPCKSNISDNNNLVQPSYYEVNKQEFKEQVIKIKEILRGGNIDKIVLSRVSIDEKPVGFNSTHFFLELQEQYPNAFVFIVFIPDLGLWLGASPEPLLQISGDCVRTVSLAGTRILNSDVKDFAWGEKELNEQSIVTQYIEGILKDFSIDQFESNGPNTLQAGSVEHLVTHFTFAKDSIKGKVFNFLSALHPTPSVCGLPKDMALDAIRMVEKHDREYYTGFLGPCNFNSEFNLYVNLRCMKVYSSKLAYFLGAGITVGSDPDMEWEETINKKKTLMNILQSLNQI